MNRMPPNRSIIFSVIIAVLLISTVLLWSGASSARPLYLQQTWPSRTPTSSSPPTDSPPGGQPTSEPPGGGPDDGTEVPPGGEGSATPIALAPTPIGGYLPTAEPCGAPPTAQSLGSVNVREGPGIDYVKVDILVYLEVRPVVGRAADATWWLIEMAEGSYGWVFDQAVFVSGYTGDVEIVEAPLVDDNTATPGSPWEPTPNPFCTPSPSPTATPTSSVTPRASVADVVLVTDTALPSSPTATETLPSTATASPFPSETPRPTATPESATNTPVPAITSEDSESVDEKGSSSMSWLLIGGVGLIAAGVIISVARRRT
ncbi:MAG: hypothetical protein WA996_06735 [Candidatus Promineifilaceae bacterium]